jgi:glycosyltransferase involved in cell wall biosynthesis
MGMDIGTFPTSTPTEAQTIARNDSLPAGRRLRVLVCAFAASPLRGSEASIGWNIPLHVARYHDVSVLTVDEAVGEPLREEIDAWVRDKGPITGLTFHFVQRRWISRLLLRRYPNESLFLPLFYLGYRVWQRAAFREAQRLHAEQPFDVVHHLSITGYREPGYVWKLDAPFVWGPIGGAANIPWSYFRGFTIAERAFYGLRNVVNHLQKRLTIRSRRAAERASHIWVIGDDERRMVSDIWARPCTQLIETAPATGTRARASPPYDGTRPLRLAWSGSHIGRKALPIALRAIALLPDVLLELWICGRGRSTARWQILARRLRISHNLKWLGWMPHDRAVATLADADAFIFTGLQEGTPAVVPEALSLGLPVVCHDTCGMKFAVNDECGIKIPRISLERSIGGFAAAIRQLAENLTELERLSRGARLRARELNWDAKAVEISRIYERVRAANGSQS